MAPSYKIIFSLKKLKKKNNTPVGLSDSGQREREIERGRESERERERWVRWWRGRRRRKEGRLF
jgi:hypothetical protein